MIWNLFVCGLFMSLLFFLGTILFVKGRALCGVSSNQTALFLWWSIIDELLICEL